MSGTYTRGPWGVERVAEGIAVQRNRNTIATVHRYGVGMVFSDEKAPWHDYDANARLIAAAPELLEALRAAMPILLEATEQWSNGEDCYDSAHKLGLAAIAKAEGGQ